MASSCDGRYLMYTQIDYGYFSIWYPEADLWLLDLNTGQKRPLDEVNSPCADSQHCWSNNSWWFLFTSRRDDGLYTRIYFSMRGDDGRATKPFLLLQRNPKQFYRMSLYSYNTTDFTSRPVETNTRQLGRNIESDHCTNYHLGYLLSRIIPLHLCNNILEFLLEITIPQNIYPFAET